MPKSVCIAIVSYCQMIPISDIRQRFSAEMGLLVLCCRVYFNTAGSGDLSGYLSESVIDWQHALSLAGHHAIRPLIYKVVSTHPDGIEPGFIKKLRIQSFAIARENMEQLKEIAAIAANFRARGIQIVPYKGVLLGHLLFNDYALRENSDIDMLILPEDFRTAKNVFTQLGYNNAQYFNDNFEDYFVRTNRELKLIRAANGNRKIKVELQWSPLHKLMGIPMTNKQLFANLGECEVPGGNAGKLDLSDELLLLFAHHGAADVWRKLKHILDIAAFVEKYRSQIDWNVFEQSLAENKLRKLAVAGCQMAELLFGIESPVFKADNSRIGADMLSGSLGFPLLSTEKTNLKHLRRHLALCGTTAERLGFLRRYAVLWLMPNMRDIKMIKLPRSLFPLYFIVRRFRFLQSAPLRK